MKKDRKSLIRAWKETPRTMGVGRIRNTKTGASLILSGRDLPALLNRHRAQLRLGVHSNRRLQADWTALGPDSFTFEVLDTLAPREESGDDPAQDLRVLEELWIERLSSSEPQSYHAGRRRTARD